MFTRFGVGVFVPRQAADDIAAFFIASSRSSAAPGSRAMPSCGKARSRCRNMAVELLARQDQALVRHSGPDGADIGEQPEEGGAVLYPHLKYAQASSCDLGRIVFALEVVGDLDRLGNVPETLGRMISPSSDLSA